MNDQTGISVHRDDYNDFVLMCPNEKKQSGVNLTCAAVVIICPRTGAFATSRRYQGIFIE